MVPEDLRRLAIALVVAAAISGCSCGQGLGAGGHDAGKSLPDLPAAPDLALDGIGGARDAGPDGVAGMGEAGGDQARLPQPDAAPDLVLVAIDGPADTVTVGDVDGASLSPPSDGPDAPPGFEPDGGGSRPIDQANRGLDSGTSGEAGPPPACAISFALGTFVSVTTTGKPAAAIATGDVNGDGKLDLLTANPSDDTISVLLGKGDGSFAAKVDYGTGAVPDGVALGDVNGDQKLDVVTANRAANTVSVLLGKGDGTFGAARDFTCGSLPYALAIADFDGDGKLDIVTANFNWNTVSVLLGKGDGTFAAKVDYIVGDGPNAVTTGDVDRDGKPDIVTVNARAGSVSVLLGKGDGTFAAQPSEVFTTTTQIVAAMVGDLDRDGNGDLVVALGDAKAQAVLAVLVGKGDGTFADPITYPGQPWQTWLGLSDVDRDGHLDIVVVGADGASALLGPGDGTFTSKKDSPVGPDVSAIVLGDFNADGKPDLAVARSADTSSGSVGVLAGTGSGAFGADKSFATAAPANSVALVDVNHDGRLDVVTAGSTGVMGSLSVLLGRSDGTLGPRQDYTVGTAPTVVVAGDLDGDGNPDLAAGDGSAVDVIFGTAGGGFGATTTYATAAPVAGLAVADLDGDGKTDLVTSNAPATLARGSVTVLLGINGGQTASRADYAAGLNPQGVAIGDVNGDHRLDIVVANGSADSGWSLGVLLGNGNGRFADEVEYPMSSAPGAIALGDVNGDGRLDVVLVASPMYGAGVAVFLGPGDGTFPKSRIFHPPLAASGVSTVNLRDVNGDGVLDVVTATSRPNGAWVLVGQGDGTFPVSATYPVDANAVVTGDLTGDGRPDVVAATPVGVTILRASCR